MTGRAKHKSRDMERSSGKRKKKKSRRHSSSDSSDCIIVTAPPESDKKRKKKKSRRHRSISSNSTSSDSSVVRLKIPGDKRKLRPLLGERPEFCRNGPRNRAINGMNDTALPRNHETMDRYSHKSSRELEKDLKEARARLEEAISADPHEKISAVEREMLRGLLGKKDNSKKRGIKDRLGAAPVLHKSKKSHKRKRSLSRSSCSSYSSTSRSSSTSSSSSSGSSTSTSSSSYERRRRRKKKRAKLKREKKKRKEERRRLKKMSNRSKEIAKDIKRSIVPHNRSQDRLLKDIHVELAGRAKAMVPMTREEWERKQKVIRRVYDPETGRHRLIKGDGEVLEEIVSRDRHMQINKQATKGDGEFFQARLRVNY